MLRLTPLPGDPVVGGFFLSTAPSGAHPQWVLFPPPPQGGWSTELPRVALVSPHVSCTALTYATLDQQWATLPFSSRVYSTLIAFLKGERPLVFLTSDASAMAVYGAMGSRAPKLTQLPCWRCSFLSSPHTWAKKTEGSRREVISHNWAVSGWGHFLSFFWR